VRISPLVAPHAEGWVRTCPVRGRQEWPRGWSRPPGGGVELLRRCQNRDPLPKARSGLSTRETTLRPTLALPDRGVCFDDEAPHGPRCWPPRATEPADVLARPTWLQPTTTLAGLFRGPPTCAPHGSTLARAIFLEPSPGLVTAAKRSNRFMKRKSAAGHAPHITQPSSGDFDAPRPSTLAERKLPSRAGRADQVPYQRPDSSATR